MVIQNFQGQLTWLKYLCRRQLAKYEAPFTNLKKRTKLLLLTAAKAWTANFTSGELRTSSRNCCTSLVGKMEYEDQACVFLEKQWELKIFEGTFYKSLCVLCVGWPKDVSIIEFQQHAVLAKLRLPWAVGVTCCQVLVHFFETLEALCHVLVVNLGIKRGHVLLAEVVSTVNMEACALLYQWHRVWAAQALLGDVLSRCRRRQNLWISFEKLVAIDFDYLRH